MSYTPPAQQLPDQNVSEDEDLHNPEVNLDDDSYGHSLSGLDAIEAGINKPKSTSGFDAAVNPSSRGAPRGRKGPAQTGPKGVKADYEAEKLRLKALRIDEAIKRERMLNRMAVGDPVFNQSNVLQQNSVIKRDDDEDDEDIEDEEDAAIFMEYKMQQMQKIKKNIVKYGTLVEIDHKQFIDFVDNTPASVFTVIHLYKDTVEPCVRLNYSLQLLAKQFPHIQFLKILVEKIRPDYPETGLPALVVFKDGQQIHSFVCMCNELGGEKFTDKDVYNFFDLNEIIKINKTATMDTSVENLLTVDSSNQPSSFKLMRKQVAQTNANDSDSSFDD